jgi:hypothetical protein
MKLDLCRHVANLFREVCGQAVIRLIQMAPMTGERKVATQCKEQHPRDHQHCVNLRRACDSPDTQEQPTAGCQQTQEDLNPGLELAQRCKARIGMKSHEGWTERIARRWLVMNHCCSISVPLSVNPP